MNRPMTDREVAERAFAAALANRGHALDSAADALAEARQARQARNGADAAYHLMRAAMWRIYVREYASTRALAMLRRAAEAAA